MSIIRALPAQLLKLDSRSTADIEQEIVDELDFHIAMRTEENVQAGLSPQEARESALSQFGDFTVIEQNCRRALLGERIMWQRLQVGLTLLLLLAVGFLAAGLYSSQQKTAEAMAKLQQLVQQQHNNPPEAQGQPLGGAPATLAAADDWRLERPVVLETIPKSGDQAVDPSLREIRITYNKRMADRSWSLVKVSDSTFPQTDGKVHYDADEQTCVIPVKLEPGRKYVVWLNSTKFQNFKDADGRPADPYLLTFSTAPQNPN